MRRRCECAQRKNEQLCLVHRLKQRMVCKKPGDKLFNLKIRETGGFVKKVAGMVKIKNWPSWTWRSIRHVKATALTASGMNFHQVVGLGQWKSGQGVMCYVDEDMVDKELFNKELVDSDTEEE